MKTISAAEARAMLEGPMTGRFAPKKASRGRHAQQGRAARAAGERVEDAVRAANVLYAQRTDAHRASQVPPDGPWGRFQWARVETRIGRGGATYRVGQSGADIHGAAAWLDAEGVKRRASVIAEVKGRKGARLPLTVRGKRLIDGKQRVDLDTALDGGLVGVLVCLRTKSGRRWFWCPWAGWSALEHYIEITGRKSVPLADFERGAAGGIETPRGRFTCVEAREGAAPVSVGRRSSLPVFWLEAAIEAWRVD